MITISARMSPSNPASKLRKVKRDLENRREIMNESKQYMIKRWNANFVGNGAIYGGWAGNSSWKEGGGGTLEGSTGALLAYFNSANAAGKVTSSSAEWNFSNSDDQFSVTHSTSGISPNPLKGHASVPQRIIWDMNETDRRYIMRALEEWIDSKVTF